MPKALENYQPKIPVNSCWTHVASGGRYLVTGHVYNVITDHFDVVYVALLHPDMVFTRQESGHEKSFDSLTEDGNPRFTPYNQED